jgi:hypothetical protein
MNKTDVISPGKHPCDPSQQDIDPVGFALQRVQTYLTWIEEHRASFEKYRQTDPSAAQKELFSLAHSTKEALRHFLRLTELLLAGYTFDPSKRLPNGLCDLKWLDRIQRSLDQDKKTPEI